MKKTFTILLILIPFFLFSQVQLVSTDASKTYPDNTRITYMQLSEYPVDIDFLQFVENEVLKNDLIQRFNLYKNGKTCFFHSHKDITEEMIVEAINDAYYLYFTTEAYATKKTGINKTNIKDINDKVFNKHDARKYILKDDYDRFIVKQNAGISISKDEFEEAVARKNYDKENLITQNEIVTKSLSNASPTRSNPCNSTITMQCGVTYNASLTSPGGSWTTYSGTGFSYPGTEQVWSFTAPTTGSYTFNVAQGSSDADFFLMASCSNTGTNLSSGYWSGVGTGTSHTITLTGGVTYYLIADLYSSNTSTTVTVSVDCPGGSVDPPPSDCLGSIPFCTDDDTYTFPASTNVPSLGRVGCLYTTPNPAWYWMEIADPGDIVINISSGADVDFIAWGPYSDLATACASVPMSACSECPNNTSNPSFYPYGEIADCSYSAASSETATISGALTGEVYVLLITNYANVTTNISFDQAGGGGSTNCGIIAPPITNNGPLCVGETLVLSVTSPPPGATYIWSGPNGFTSSAMNPTISNVTTTHAGTYSLVITIGSETSPPVTTNVVINPNVTPIFTQVDPYCAGETIPTLPTTSTNGITGTWSPAINNTSTTTYTFTPTAGQCATTTTMTITINPLPTISAISATPPTICEGESSNLNATSVGNTINWWTASSGGSLLSSTLSGVNYTVTPSSTTTYYAEVESQTSGGGSSSNLTTTYAAGNGFHGNMFDVDVLNNIVVNSFDVHAPVEVYDYEVYYKTGTWVGFEANASAWTLIGTANGIVGSGVGLATPLNLNLNLSLTAGQTYAFYVTATGGSIKYSDGTAVGNICASNSDIQIKEGWGGAYPFGTPNTPRIWNGTIHYSTEGLSGCISASRTPVTVTVNPNLTPTFAEVGPYCAGSVFAVLPTTSINGITGTWAPVIDNTATTIYTFTPTAGQCATTTTQIIEITPNITPIFTEIGPYCSGETIPALPTTSNNGVTGTWFPAINNISTTTYTFTPTAGQCATTVTQTITITPNEAPTFAAVGSYCYGATIPELPTTSTNGITGTWSPAINNTATTTYTFTPTAGQCATTTTLTILIESEVTPVFDEFGPYCSGATIPALPTTSNNGVNGIWSPAINNTATTTYIFTPTDGGCALPTTQTIIIEPNITPTFADLGPYCSGDVVPALPTVSIEGVTGTWSPEINNTETTVYTFTPTAGECATTTTQTIIIEPNVTPTFEQMGPYIIGASVTPLPTVSIEGISGTWSPEINNTATTTYTFTPTAGQCATTTTMIILINAEIVPVFNEFGPYCSGTTIPELPTTSNNGISGTWSPAINNIATTTYTFTPTLGQNATTQTLTITINPNPTASVSGNSPLCSGDSNGSLNVAIHNGLPQYIINWGTNSTSISGNNYTIPNVSAGEYQIVITDANGCTNSVIANLAEPAGIETTVVSGNPSCIGNNDGYIELTVAGGASPYFYNWGGGEPSVNYLSGLTKGTYIVTITDANQCVYELNPIILVDVKEDCITIPNAFTPNGDNINDTWVIGNIEMFPAAYIYIFNRWGQPLFHAKGLDDPWDGTYNGEFVPSGTYMYVINLFNGNEPYTGSVSVVY